MGLTIQFESHTGELALIYEYEHDRKGVLEYYDQPPPIKLLYQSINNRHLGVLHTPDFFVIRSDSAGYEECKPEEKLIQLAEKSPNRFVRGEDGEWRCPPGEEFAAKYGLYYRIRSMGSISWTLQRNVVFLDDFLRFDNFLVSEQAQEAVLTLVERERDITLRDLLLRTEGTASADDVFKMIATEEVYVDWSAAPLAEPDLVHIFPNAEIALAYSQIVRTSPVTAVNSVHTVHVRVNSIVKLDNRDWKIINVGETKVGLLATDGEYVGLPCATFDELVKKGEIIGTASEDKDQNGQVRKLLATAMPKDLEIANFRYGCIFPEMRPDGGEEPQMSERTRRRYFADYRSAELLYGCGYVGLLPSRDEDGRGRGNYQPKISEATRALALDFIKNDYETYKQKGKYHSWVMYKNKCDEQSLIACSYKTFIDMVEHRSRYEQTGKRKGRRGAYKFKIAYWSLDRNTPRHGDRPFEIGHIDHTELDVELVCSYTGRNLGRPWLTLLTDANSRRILVVYLTYDPPSRRTCMMVLRDCVRIYGLLPQFVIVDNGPEFRSVYFHHLLSSYERTIKYRPKAEPRFGSVCERLFGTTNTQFIHNLRGNTQIMRNPREATKSVNPKSQAVWTLENLYERLCEYAYEIYDNIDHPALGQTPKDAFDAGMKMTGKRAPAGIPYDEDFIMRTMPSTDKGTAKVQACGGVKINNKYYFADAFRDPDVQNKQVSVRYDPYNAARAFAVVRGQWVKCVSDHRAAFEGRSEREIMLATKELHKRNRLNAQYRFTLTAKMLADFLTSVEVEEGILTQRLKDREARGILAKINGGFGAPKGVADLIPLVEVSRSQSTDTDRSASEANVDAAPEQHALKVYGEY
ncbi:MAG TPA: Mu transposase C-terminal domain-containing protein [Pyrinomonadaceae bacterium]|nr:Mu transposase C-terminal domain-containing protein [Pyrinomonadaceae bacterium]